MSNFKRISFTGIDDFTDLSTLSKITEYPLPFEVEFGVLFYKSGKNRCPSFAVRESLYKLKQEKNLNLSAHLCGDIALWFLQEPNYFCSELQHYQRIQLNINIFKLLESKQFTETSLISAFDKLFNSSFYQTKKIITQVNANNQNKAITEFLQSFSQWNPLFDCSLGKGVTPTSWPIPLSTACHLNTYAGGITPDNIKQVFKEVSMVVNKSAESNFALDLESGVRTLFTQDDQTFEKFDLYKVHKIISTLSNITSDSTI